MKAICKTRCFFGGREWLPGEALDVGEGEIPAHFRASTDKDPDDRRLVKKVAQSNKAPQPETASDRASAGEPVALSELTSAAKTDDVTSLL